MSCRVSLGANQATSSFVSTPCFSYVCVHPCNWSILFFPGWLAGWLSAHLISLAGWADWQVCRRTGRDSSSSSPEGQAPRYEEFMGQERGIKLRWKSWGISRPPAWISCSWCRSQSLLTARSAGWLAGWLDNSMAAVRLLARPTIFSPGWSPLTP